MFGAVQQFIHRNAKQDEMGTRDLIIFEVETRRKSDFVMFSTNTHHEAVSIDERIDHSDEIGLMEQYLLGSIEISGGASCWKSTDDRM